VKKVPDGLRFVNQRRRKDYQGDRSPLIVKSFVLSIP